MSGYLFVGERPSRLAAQIGATWQNAKLAGRTLRAALVAAGLDPTGQLYLNLYSLPDRSEQDRSDEQAALVLIRQHQADGWHIVGMGQIVCAVLRREGIAHLPMVHPAARGAIRRRERYQAHVASVLGININPL